MYSKRLKIFIMLCLFMTSIVLLRLLIMQTGQSRQQAIELTNKMRNKPAVVLPTLRGKISDRNGKILAVDTPRFYLYMNYNLTRLLDERWQFAQLMSKTRGDTTEEQAREKLCEEYADDLKTLFRAIQWCSKLPGNSEKSVREEISKINDTVWNMRSYVAWRKYYPARNFSEFEKTIPEKKEQVKMAFRERIIEMTQNYPIVELKNEDEKFSAEFFFAESKNVSVASEPVRQYPYGDVASQIIGWVKPKSDSDDDDEMVRLLAKDKLASYQGQELAGFAGVEWVCEPYLRGRRGLVEYDRDGQLVSESQTQFGLDISLTIDIELQKKVEQMLADPEKNKLYRDGGAAVLIDVATGEILVMASIPTFDLNKVRSNYLQYRNDAGRPFISKAIEKIYPPGSTLKPLILIAGMEEQKITPGTVISCPAENAPRGWPSCWIWRQLHSCHDYEWENTARNALKGSCNIYCSHVANMLESGILQRWLYSVGFGHRLLPVPDFPSANLDGEELENIGRNLRESGGVIWTGFASIKDKPLSDLPDIAKYEKRHFGIGQASMRATILQVANYMSSIARGGVYRQVRLYKDNSTKKFENLGISTTSITTIKDGMYAVVNETGGTAKKIFAVADHKSYGVTVYGKTGSTQGSDNALFAGFFEDTSGRAIAMAIIVEKGQSGAQDAAPLGRQIVDICIDSGYIGNKIPAGK